MANYQLIRDICKEKGFSLKQLAEAIGITEPGLQKLLRTKSTKISTLESIAQQLEVPINQFFSDDPNDRLYFSEEEISNLLKKMEIAQMKSFSESIFIFLVKDQRGGYYMTKTGVLNLLFDFIESDKRMNRYGILIDKLLEDKKGLKE